MFILSLNEKLSDTMIKKIEDCLFCKRMVQNSPLYFVIDNPLHYKNQNISIDFKQYKSVYIVSNNKLKLNSALSNTLNKSTNSELLNILCKSFQDMAYVNNLIESIVNSKRFSLKILLEIKLMLSDMLEKIYFNNQTFNTSLVINKMRNELTQKSSLSYLETLKLDILNTRANRFTLTLIKTKIKEAINLIYSSDLNNYNITELLDEKEYTLIYTNYPFSSIKSSSTKNHKIVSDSPTITTLKFNNIETFTTKKFSSSNNIKYLYLIKNKIVVYKISYLDLLKEINGEAILLNIFSNIDISNLNMDYLSKEFIEEMSKHPKLNLYFKNNFYNSISHLVDFNFSTPSNETKNVNLKSKSLSILDLVNESCEVNFN